MPLDEYRRKRHFDKTPEPAGDVEPAGERLRYVIQKHAASHLHWDFRIELDGVLLSWAVPKGPSLDPRDKRLAMHVEDHPVEYGRFEGTIPKGEYGGGTVMLWDRGEWEPDHGDPRAHLAEGHLKFHLFGERLRGRWMLVRTKGYGGQRDSWLIFKEHDEHERPREEFDATEQWVTSVTTGRTMQQIADGADAVWHSTASVEENLAAGALLGGPQAAPGAEAGTAGVAERSSTPEPGDTPGAKRTGQLPTDTGVQLATLVNAVPEGDRWLHEIKFDGYRILAHKRADGVRLISRNGKDWTDRFKQVAAAVDAEVSAGTAVIDGEVVVVQADGTTSFQALQNFARHGADADLHYQVFDLLQLDGWDLRESPLEDRKRLLRSIVPAQSSSATVRYTDHIEGHGDVFYSRACDYSLEGVISKRRDSKYRAGRQRDWVKNKCLNRQEFVVVGFTDPGGSREGFGALVLAVHEGDRLVHVGRVGSGFSDRTLRDLHARLLPRERDDAPVINPPTGAAARGIHWVEPALVAQVEFTEWTDERLLRHPSFLGLREDKPANDVFAEQPEDSPDADALAESENESAPSDDGGANDAAKSEPVTVAGVRVTNPDRVLWPDTGTTKLQLASHYEAVAELMLPHVIGRPLSLVRCPGGYTGQCFYQKEIKHFPASVHTVDVYVPEDDVVKPYGTVDDLAGLIGLVQMGVLEIHLWGSENSDIESPDRLVFDLDPDPSLPFAQVRATAMLLRSELERRGLESWVKTTGGKGLHVVLPIVAGSDWSTAKGWAKGFVDSIVATEPRMFTSNMSKSKRDSKIFIDYLRNARGATAIAPYSTRSRPGAPVAMPLAWEELEAMSERPEFSVDNVRSYLAERAADPWSDMLTTVQRIDGQGESPGRA